MKSVFIVIFCLTFICFSFYPETVASSKKVSIDVPPEVFINGSNNDLSNIFLSDIDLEGMVQKLYDTDLLPHKGAIYYPEAPEFNEYWKAYSSHWNVVKLQPNSNQIELIFNGKLSTQDAKEAFELYTISIHDGENTGPIFRADGKLIAYKMSPFTSEIVLYIHDYPCCNSAGNNIIKLRVVNGETKPTKRFFIARDSEDITGPFFPKTSNFSNNIHQLNEDKDLHWSPENISQNAFKGQSNRNFIGRFQAGSNYYILNQWDDNWQFVLLLNGIQQVQSAVINPINFENRPIFGFISKEIE